MEVEVNSDKYLDERSSGFSTILSTPMNLTGLITVSIPHLSKRHVDSSEYFSAAHLTLIKI